MPTTTERIRSHFISYAKKLLLDFENVLDTHPGDLGDNRERGLEIFLKEHFPPAYEVFRGGKVIDSQGQESKQTDILICNSFVPRLVTENRTLYFVESVLGAIECKSFLSKEELRDCLQKCASMKQLSKKYQKGTEFFGSDEFTYKFDTVHFSIFAYDSPEMETVTDNIIKLSAEMGLDVPFQVDAVCILKKGVIFKPAYPGLDGGLKMAPQGSKPYIFKPLEFEGLAYFLIQLHREFQHIRFLLFDMTLYEPQFEEGWFSRFIITPNPSTEPNS